jgi:hypothetical protein
MVKWKLVLVSLEIVLNSTQGRCTVCAKCTVGSKIAFGHNKWYTELYQKKMEVLGGVDQVEDPFSLFGEC